MYHQQLGTARVDARSAEILDKVRSTFAQKGFDGASMKDLAEAAGMSAGNFYRYFPGKSAIVEALIARQLDAVRRDFAHVLESPDPRGTLRDLVRRRLSEGDCEEGAFWAEIEAAASRRPEIAAIKDQMSGEVMRSLIAIFARLAEVPTDEARQRFGAHARLIVMLVQGVMMHAPGAAICPGATGPGVTDPGAATGAGTGAGTVETDRALAALVVDAIDHILAQITAPQGHDR